MVQQNRILTVSYGTFSCTLEGFSDPFDTMKLIADYFRDLAAEDRHFGADPVQWDPAGLERFTAHQARSPVRARMSGNSVILSAGADPAGAFGGQEPSESSAAGPLTAPEGGAAERLARLRAAVAERATEDPAFAEEMPDLTDLKLDLIPDTCLGEDLIASGSRTAASLLAEAQRLGEEAVSVPPEKGPDIWSVARGSGQTDRRRRLRNQALTSDTVLAADSIHTRAADTEAAAEAAELSSVAERVPGDGVSQAEEVSSAAAEGQVIPVAPLRLSERISAEVPDLSEALSGAEMTPAAPEAEAAPHEAVSFDRLEDEFAALTAEAESGPVAAPLMSEPSVTPASPAQEQADTLLMEAPARETIGAAAESTGPVKQAVMSPAAAGQGAVSVDRLIRQVGTEMEEAGTRRRNSTITHLKAAVAATEADRRAPGAERARPDLTEDYRNDLADAVSTETAEPGRTPPRVAPLLLVSSLRVPRKAAETGSGRAATPLRPRRVTAATPGTGPERGEPVARPLLQGAAEAEALLLRAAQTLQKGQSAAAFNRPQLMQSAGLQARGFTREEALIAFGSLLREGRILRASRGEFSLPPETNPPPG